MLGLKYKSLCYAKHAAPVLTLFGCPQLWSSLSHKICFMHTLKANKVPRYCTSKTTSSLPLNGVGFGELNSGQVKSGQIKLKNTECNPLFSVVQFGLVY